MNSYFSDLTIFTGGVQLPLKLRTTKTIIFGYPVSELRLLNNKFPCFEVAARKFITPNNLGEIWVHILRRQGQWIGVYGKKQWLVYVSECEKYRNSMWSDNFFIYENATLCWPKIDIVNGWNQKLQQTDLLWYAKYDVYNQIIVDAAKAGTIVMHKKKYVSDYVETILTNHIAINIYMEFDNSTDYGGSGNTPTIQIPAIDETLDEYYSIIGVEHPSIPGRYIFPETCIGIFPVFAPNMGEPSRGNLFFEALTITEDTCDKLCSMNKECSNYLSGLNFY